jgi:hypothetical protein
VNFVRFPHTPHLAWLGKRKPRHDKILTPNGARELLAHQVTVEEKVDGANVGFSVDEHGDLRIQSRGSYLSRESSHPQFKPLFRWLEHRRDTFIDVLAHDLILFGEWCYAVHSIHYSKLPDWFLAFDVFDRANNFFWSVARRDELARKLAVEIVPRMASGRFGLPQLASLLDKSKLRDGPPEGLYIRCDEVGRLIARAKLVREEFVQSIDAHWSRGPLRANGLATESRIQRY